MLLNDEAAYGFVRDPRVYSSATESRSDGVISTGPLGVLSWANYALLTVTIGKRTHSPLALRRLKAGNCTANKVLNGRRLQAAFVIAAAKPGILLAVILRLVSKARRHFPRESS